MLEEIHEVSALKEAVGKYPVVVAGFYSPHCEVCKELAPLFKEGADKFPEFAFLRVNIMEPKNQELLKEFDIESPTLMIFKDGKEFAKYEVERYGAEKMKEEINKFFSSLQ